MPMLDEKLDSLTIEELAENPKPISRLDEDEFGSAFAHGDRLFVDLTRDDIVSLGWDIEVTDLAKMLAADGNARKIERVLTLPIRGAEWFIESAQAPASEKVKERAAEGGKASSEAGERPRDEIVDFLEEVLGPELGRIIEQCTAAITYRRAYFEKVWTVDERGRFVYQKVAWRPPAGCTPRFDRRTGEARGFYQRLTETLDLSRPRKPNKGEELPGHVTVPAAKAFIYTHGRHREPIKGVSDLEVALNAYEKKRKIKFLWAQFLENQSLPKTVVYGTDPGQATQNAKTLAKARASSVVPMTWAGDGNRPFDVIESSGSGAGQFLEALRYFDWEQTNSVLAGFTELANSSTGAGSYALSSDQSEFFLASEQAAADEIADQIVEGLFKPLVVLNFGPDVEVPRLRIGPIGRQQTDRALELLTAIVSATRPLVPLQFVGMLLTQVAEQLGLDVSEVDDVVEQWGDDMQAQLQSAYAAQLAAAQQPTAFGPGDSRSTGAERAVGYQAAEQEGADRRLGRPTPGATATAGDTTGADLTRVAADNALRKTHTRTGTKKPAPRRQSSTRGRVGRASTSRVT